MKTKTWKCAYDGTLEKLADGRCAACGRSSLTESKRDAKAWDQKPQHTPTPWRVDYGEPSYITEGRIKEIVGADDSVIVETDGGYYDPSAIDAAFIVRACNSHEAYKDVAMYARALIRALEQRFMRTGASDTEEMALQCLEEAIKEAERK